MIKEYEVGALLSIEFPELHKQLTETSRTINVFRAVQCFAEYTIRLMKEDKLEYVKGCFGAAEKILKDGTGLVRIAIENVFVFSVTSAMDQLPLSGKNVREVMTPAIRSTYQRQVFSNHV